MNALSSSRYAPLTSHYDAAVSYPSLGSQPAVRSYERAVQIARPRRLAGQPLPFCLSFLRALASGAGPACFTAVPFRLPSSPSALQLSGGPGRGGISLSSTAQLLYLTSELLLIVWLACRLFCCRPAPSCT